MTTWPYPERPGVPLNPEVDGWHWAERYRGVPICLWWCAEWHRNGYSGWGKYEDGRLADWTYLGPVRTDADVQAAAKAARQQALEDAAGVCDAAIDRAFAYTHDPWERDRVGGYRKRAAEIRALKEGGE